MGTKALTCNFLRLHAPIDSARRAVRLIVVGWTKLATTSPEDHVKESTRLPRLCHGLASVDLSSVSSICRSSISHIQDKICKILTPEFELVLCQRESAKHGC